MTPAEITQLHPTLSRQELHRRFSGKVERTETCWLWRGAINRYGYGLLVARRGGKVVIMPAHRISYVLHVGPIPDGRVIDHLCRVRSCVNPRHLDVVTIAENIARGETGRHLRALTHCPKGHPYEGDNLAICQGSRVCITCRRANARARYHAKKGMPR